MSVVARVVSSGGEGLLVEVTVRLKNIGGSRIDARTGYQAGKFLYDDGWDQCEHAGTLKIRAVPQKPVPLVFDWYGLKPLAATLTLSAPHKAPSEIAPRSGMLEQINYLADFQDPVGGFTDVGFWMEPNETYELTVPLWLAPGDYAVKAFFLGQDRSHAEEEFWSQTHYCRLEPPPPNPPLQPASGALATS